MPTGKPEQWSQSIGIDKETLKDIKALKSTSMTDDRKLSEPTSTGLSSGQAVSVKPNLKSYVGTKVILARPMTEHEFLKTVKGKTDEELRQQETQGNGYEVTYEDNYISWSPKGVFERCYREISQQEGQMVYTANISPKH